LLKQKLSPSALAILLVCAATCYKGANVILFLRGPNRLADVHIEAGAGAPADRFGTSFAESWKNYSGVAERARRLNLEIVGAGEVADQSTIERATAEIAENSPTSDTTWLDLADVRLARGEPMESVLAAFRMSSMVGSHEGESMVRRAVFGLEHWSKLPEADRQTVLRDIAGTDNPLDVEQYNTSPQRYREILETKSATERGEILAALTASGLVAPNVLKALGE
jgi:hypothetical protein